MRTGRENFGPTPRRGSYTNHMFNLYRSIVPTIMLAACSCHSSGPTSAPASVPSVGGRTIAMPDAASGAPQLPVAKSQPTAFEARRQQLLAAIGPLKAVTQFVDGDVIIVSGTHDDGTAISCRKNALLVQCVPFAGYEEIRLQNAFAKSAHGAASAPAWVNTILELDAQFAAADEVIPTIEAQVAGAEPVLLIGGIDGSELAIRRKQAWILSPPVSGGVAGPPLFYGSIDLSALVGSPAIGMMVGGYEKEGCLRMETDSLLVMGVTDKLTEIGRFTIGVGLWISDFETRSEEYFLIRLQPKVVGEQLQLTIVERHTPANVAKRKEVCGMQFDVADVTSLARKVGGHTLADLLAAGAVETKAREAR